MSVWNVAPFKFNITGNDTLLSSWREITTLTPRENNHWTVTAIPNYAVQQVGYVDMGLHTPMSNAIDEDRLTLDENGTFVLNIRGVSHIDATLNKTVNLEVVGRDGFTTNGTFNSVTTKVGNHEIRYTGATRDSTLFTGTGWDQIRLIDHPGVAGTQYWSLVRRADGEIDAYSLYSGYKVRMEGGGTTWGNANGRLNYGEVDEIYLASRNRPGGDMFMPGANISATGDRGGFDNIDLSDAAVTNYTDRFIAASFKSIHYATQNVHDGTAIVETFNGDTAGGTQSASRDHINTNGNQHLIVDQEAVEIDGHLRVYVRDNNSGLYNRFNEVYLGTSTANVNTNNYNTTSKNAYATNQSTGQGANSVLGTAMYGFGGNDVLTGGNDVDFLFGGTSTFTTITPASLPGNILTGGDGADYFGVGNISAGQDGDDMMATDFALTNRLAGTAPLATDDSGKLSRTDVSDAADLATRVATDRITDWTAGVDYLRVLGNGTAIVQGLGTANGGGAGGYVVDPIGNDAERIDLSGNRVVNDGKIVARGLGGSDTLIGSSGDDWLYGNAASNNYNLNAGGNDRIYIDQFDGGRSKHYVEGFVVSTGSATDTDLVMLNKRVIDAFNSAGANRGALTQNVNAEYVGGQKYNSGLNFLHDSFYNPAIAAPNSVHESEDGRGLFMVPVNPSGSDGTSGFIGLGMTIAGRALLAVPFVGPIIGGALIATGTLLGGAGNVVTTSPHRNATYAGNVGAYLNVLTDDFTNAGNGVMLKPNTTIGNNDAGVRFLDFFQSSDAGDGYIPVVEFTAHPNQGIYGYFALHSDDETFVFLVASRDNLVENSEAILVAQINGRLTAADFGIYDGELDVYNYGVLPAVVMRDPSITVIADSKNPADEGQTDGKIESASNPIKISGSVDGALAEGSFFRVYDGAKKIYDGAVAVDGQQVSLNLNGTSFTFTDSRSLGTTVRNTTNSKDINGNPTGNDTWVLSDARVLYTVELVDGDTGIPTRVSARSITISGGNGVIDGGDGTDLLLITETSPYVNNLGNDQLQGIETISLAPNPLAAASVTIESGAITAISFAGNTGSGLQDGSYEITVSDEPADTGTPGSGALATVTVSGGSITSATVINGGSNYREGTQALFTPGVNLSLTAQQEGIQVIGGSGNDTVNGGSGNDTINGLAGSDVLDGGSANDTFVYAAFADLFAGGVLVDSITGGEGADTIRIDQDTAFTITTTDSFARSNTVETLAAGAENTGNISITLGSSAFTAGIRNVTLAADTNSAGSNTINTAAQKNIAIGLSLTGSAGIDYIVGGAGDDTIRGGGGADTINAGGGTNSLIDAGVGADAITHNMAGSVVINVTGTDVVTLTASVAGATSNSVSGSNTIVNASTSTSSVTLNGNDGNDSLIGGNADDLISGAGGNDTINGGAGADSLSGGAGTNFYVFNTGDIASGESLTFTGGANEIFRVDSSADFSEMNGGNSALTGLSRIYIASGESAKFTGAQLSGVTATVFGVSGGAAETLNIQAIGNAQTIDLNQITVTDVSVSIVGSAGGNTIKWGDSVGAVSIEGGAGDDYIDQEGGGSSSLADTILGADGNDTIYAGDGNDIIVGGAGADELSGETGRDTFRYLASSDSNSAAIDEITDFTFGNTGDYLDVSAIDGNGRVGYSKTMFASLTDLENFAKSSIAYVVSGARDVFLGRVGSDVYVLTHPTSMVSWSTSDANSSIIKLEGASSTFLDIVAANFVGSSDVKEIIPPTDITSGSSGATVSGPVLVSSSNFGGVTTIDNKVYVSPELTTTDEAFSISSWDFRSSGEVITTQKGLIGIGDTYTFFGSRTLADSSTATGVAEVLAVDANDVAFAISGMTNDTAFQNSKSFFYLEGFSGARDVFSENHGALWYWQDSGDGIAQSGELTLIAIHPGLSDPTTQLQYTV